MKNLDDGIDDERLRKEFSPYGTITSAKVRDWGCPWSSWGQSALGDGLGLSSCVLPRTAPCFVGAAAICGLSCLF